VPQLLDLAIQPVTRRAGFEADLQPTIPACQLPDRSLNPRRRVLDLAQAPNLAGAASLGDATACFLFATSNATNAPLYSPMVRPPCVRLGSARPSNPRSSCRTKGRATKLSPGT
jgi:hypothetical protein